MSDTNVKGKAYKNKLVCNKLPHNFRKPSLKLGGTHHASSLCYPGLPVHLGVNNIIALVMLGTEVFPARNWNEKEMDVG